MVLTLLIFLTSCKTAEYIYVVPDIQSPAIQEQPQKKYIDGGFKANVPDELTISDRDAKILSGYIIDLKIWGQSGWEWVKYYIAEIEKLKMEAAEREE